MASTRRGTGRQIIMNALQRIFASLLMVVIGMAFFVVLAVILIPFALVITPENSKIIGVRLRNIVREIIELFNFDSDRSEWNYDK